MPKPIVPPGAKPHGRTGVGGRAEFYSHAMAAKMLRVKVGTIRALVDSGKLTAVGAYTVDRDEVERILFDIICGDLLTPGQKRILNGRPLRHIPEWVIAKAQREIANNPGYRPSPFIAAMLLHDDTTGQQLELDL